MPQIFPPSSKQQQEEEEERRRRRLNPMGKKKNSFTSLLSKLIESPKSSPKYFCSSTTPKTTSFRSSSSDHDSGQPDPLDSVIRGLSSDRLFFEPGETSPVLEYSKSRRRRRSKMSKVAFMKESVVVSMESSDPYHDFRASMEEMVMAHGIKESEQLEELLIWYLSVNGKKTHGFIVGAFVDVILGVGSTTPCSSTSSCSIAFDEVEKGREPR